MSASFEIVIMTTAVSGTPHERALRDSNPGIPIHVRESIQGEGADLETRWYNCDRNIRAWWRSMRELVCAREVLFLEYDVFCNVDLTSLIRPLPLHAGIAAAKIMSGVRDRRSFWPFADIPRLPREMTALACATAPLAVLLISRRALDAIIDPRYDAVFEDNVFAEVRLPTVIRHAGFSPIEYPLPDVGCVPFRPGGRSGIFHPVKEPVT